MSSEFLYPFIVGMLAAAASGLLSVFVVFRRMALVGDALSHVALPGIGVALLLGFSPTIGALAALILAAFAIFALIHKTKLYEETLVGILFSISLALGVLFLEGEELEAALFGDLARIATADFLLSVLVGSIIFFGIKKLYKSLALSSFSADLARSQGVNLAKTDFIFLILLSFAVVLGIKVLGTLLVGSLLIIPAAAAQNISFSLRQMMCWSVAISVASVFFGILLATFVFSSVTAGPVIVLMEGALFVITIFFKR